MKERIIELYEFNSGRGYVGLYFTKKEMQVLKREYNIRKCDSLQDAYQKVHS